MNENPRFLKMLVLLVGMTFLATAFGTSPLNGWVIEPKTIQSESLVEEINPDENQKIPIRTGTRALSPRTVLAELFTNWGCPPCAYACPAINELMDVYNSSQLVMIAYHVNWPASDDPFYLYNSADNDARVAYYSVSGVPSMFFDGPPNVGTGPSTSASYTLYKSAIDSAYKAMSPITITLEGFINPMTMNAAVNATIEVTDPLPVGTLNVRFAVVEDNQYALGTNGEPRHRYVMRDMLLEELLPPLMVGQSYNVSRTFAVDPMLNINSISVVVFVQNDVDKDVLQAASYDFIPQDLLVIDDDESGHPDGFEDFYHELLCQMMFPFDGWVLNERGSVTSNYLANYKVVLWITADTSTSTLTIEDQDAISNYLDNGRGSLFLCGSNVGFDIGSMPFFNNYLHAEFITDNTGANQITGVKNDPISDPFSASTYPISFNSPSEVNPIFPAKTVFLYSPSLASAAIRAEHDIDSRVVYLAFMYFEGGDTDINKMMVMGMVLAWLLDMNYRIALSPGFNLVSIPNIQIETSLDTVLESIQGQYDSAQWYNISDSTDPWKHFHTGKLKMNDLLEITHYIGFWVHVTLPKETIFVYKGLEPMSNQSIDLRPGWNLVGYPSLTSYDRTQGLNKLTYGTEVDSIWTFDSAVQKWNELCSSDYFEPGTGYWVHATTTCVWEVPL